MATRNIQEITRTDYPRASTNLDERRAGGPEAVIPQMNATADQASQKVLATHARTSFNFASLFLPPEVRTSTVVLYSFFRVLDNLVDEPAPERTPGDIKAELDAWRAWMHGDRSGSGPREQLARQLMLVIERHAIPTDLFDDFIDGLERDLAGFEIRDQCDLEAYCYQVASTVGVAMAHTLGSISPEALHAARQLGAAMQLTNILRDVGEDLSAGRVYLPCETLARYGHSRATLLEMASSGRDLDRRYKALMKMEISRARELYATGLTGIWHLPKDNRFAILVASRLYRKLLAKIEDADYDTLHVRVRTNRLDKVFEAITSQLLVRLWKRGERS